MNEIGQFEGDFHFLSNFSSEGGVKPTVEHHFQAAKTDDPKRKKEILAAPTPGIAKKMGNDRKRTVLIDNWESEKLSVMWELLKQKFGQRDARDKLLATGDAKLVEGNYWGDTYWGVSTKTGEGENWLGRLLEKVRTLTKEAK